MRKVKIMFICEKKKEKEKKMSSVDLVENLLLIFVKSFLLGERGSKKRLREVVKLVDEMHMFKTNPKFGRKREKHVQKHPFKKEIVPVSEILYPVHETPDGIILTMEVVNYKNLIDGTTSSKIKEILKTEIETRKNINLSEISMKKMSLYFIYSDNKTYGYIFFYEDRKGDFHIKRVWYESYYAKHIGSYTFYSDTTEEFFKKRFNLYLIQLNTTQKKFIINIWDGDKFLEEFILYPITKQKADIHLLGKEKHTECYYTDQSSVQFVKNALFYIMSGDYKVHNINEFIIAAYTEIEAVFDKRLKKNEYLIYLVGKEEYHTKNLFSVLTFSIKTTQNVKYCYIIATYTVEDYQRRGYGRILHQFLEKKLKADGIHWIIISSKKTSVGFWSKMGYDKLFKNVMQNWMYKNLYETKSKLFFEELSKLKEGNM